MWETSGIGPYRYNKFLLDVHIPGNYVASTWVGATLTDGNVVETVMNERTRVWMIIIEGQESQVDLVGWNLIKNDKYFLLRDHSFVIFPSLPLGFLLLFLALFLKH